MPTSDRRQPYRLTDRGQQVLTSELTRLQPLATRGVKRLGRPVD